MDSPPTPPAQVLPPGHTVTAAAPRRPEMLVTRNFLTLGGGELFARVIGFGATIYAARQLGVDGYGVTGFAFALVLYAAAVTDLGLEQFGPAEVARRTGRLDAFVSSLLITRLGVSALLSLLLALFGTFWLTQPEGGVLALYGLMLIAHGASAKWVHIGCDRTGIVSVARIAAEAVKVVLVVSFVRGPEDVLAVPVAHVIGDVVGSAILGVALLKRGIRLHFTVDRAIVRAVLLQARPLLLTHLLALIIYNADVVLLRIFRDRAEVGLYLAAYTLITFLGALGNVVTLSLVPSLSRLQSDSRAMARLAHTAMAGALAAGLPFAVGGFLIAEELLDLVFGAEYAAAALALRILIWSIPLLLLRSVEQAVLLAQHRQDRVLHTTLAAAAVNLVVNVVAIPLFGIPAAAITTVIAELVRLSLARHFASQGGIELAPFVMLWKPLCAAGALAAVLVLADPRNVAVAVLLGTAVYVGALALLRVDRELVGAPQAHATGRD